MMIDALASVGLAVILAYLAVPTDPVADLTERLRRPFLWAVKHPVQAIRRAVR